MIDFKRVTIFTGHFGSGKTEVAINYALELKKSKENVAIVDFDIVNPYFRTKDAEEILTSKGIKVISSQYANTNIENPAIPPEINMLFENKDYYVVFDVGGDDDGATPLGRYHGSFAKEDYDMFFVLNERRLLTCDVESSAEMLRVIENCSRLKATGIINNTHLKEYTTVDNILAGQKLAEKVQKLTGLEIKYITGLKSILDKLPESYDKLKFPLDLYINLRF